jgi:hypothetical protein
MKKLYPGDPLGPFLSAFWQTPRFALAPLAV